MFLKMKITTLVRIRKVTNFPVLSLILDSQDFKIQEANICVYISWLHQDNIKIAAQWQWNISFSLLSKYIRIVFMVRPAFVMRIVRFLACSPAAGNNPLFSSSITRRNLPSQEFEWKPFSSIAIYSGSEGKTAVRVKALNGGRCCF